MSWTQRTLRLPPFARGCHLVTDQVVQALPELAAIRTGILHVFIQHTSAAISINENADPDVPRDLAQSFDRVAPEDAPYTHTCEGPDDMPAHVKSSLVGSSISVPVADGELLLGTWQGVYLCEFRNRGGRRNLVLTLWGESRTER